MFRKVKAKNSPWQKALFISLISFFTFFSVLFLLLNLKTHQQRGALEKGLAGLKEKENFVLKEAEQLKAVVSQSESADFLEEKAREDFNLKREGERVIVFPLPDNHLTAKAQPTAEKKNILEKILEKFWP